VRRPPDLEVVELDAPPPQRNPEPGSAPTPTWLLLVAAVVALVVGRAVTSASQHPKPAAAAAVTAAPRTSDVGSLFLCDGRLDGSVIFGDLPPDHTVHVQATPVRGPDVAVPGPGAYRVGADGRLLVVVVDMHVPGRFADLPMFATADRPPVGVVGWSVDVPVADCGR
jgi:hypothetical protein